MLVVVLFMVVILFDIVSEVGVVRVRSWIVEFKGRRRGRKEMVLEFGFFVGISISVVYIIKDLGFMIRYMLLFVFRMYVNNLSLFVFYMRCYRK